MASKQPAETLDFLLVNISHLHRIRAHQLLEAIGLYRGQPPVLRALWETEGLTQTDLAARMEVTPATMTKMLQRMEKTGFIYRQNDPQDQRISRVYLTDTGRSIQESLESTWESFENETFGSFTTEEQVQLRSYLLRIRDNLLVATGETPWER